MNKREKILAATILTLAVVIVGVRFGSSLFATVFVGQSVVELQKKYDTLADENETELIRLVETYKEFGRQTLGRDATEAKTRLDLEIKHLVDRCSLGNSRYYPKNETRFSKKSDMLIIPYNVTAEGTLESVVTFLARFDAQPFLWGIKSLTLTPADAKGGDRVRLSADIETVVLPALELKLKDSDGKPMDPLADYAVAERDSTKRDEPMTETQLASAYGDIWAEQFFTPYKPPPPPPPKPQPKPQPPPRQPVVQKPPPPRPDPRWTQTTLVGVMQVEGVYEAVAFNSQKNQREYYRVGDPCADGTIILVHPRAMVIRKNGKDYVISRGAALSPGKVLTDEEFPEIYHAVAELAMAGGRGVTGR